MPSSHPEPDLARVLADLESQADPKGDVMLDAAALLRAMATDFAEYASHGLDDRGVACPLGDWMGKYTTSLGTRCTCGLVSARKRWNLTEPVCKALSRDDALTVAKFCWPDVPWQADVGGDPAFVFALVQPDPRHSDKIEEHARSFEDVADIADAERILVARGLGEAYGRELRCALGFDKGCYWISMADIAAIRNAPLDVCLRAMAAAIREAQSPHGVDGLA